MKNYLDESYLPELFKACLNKRDMLLIVRKYMKTSYIPEKTGYREVWKAINTYMDKEGRPPTVGILSQKLAKVDEADDALGEIRSIITPDYEGLISSFSEFIKQHKFIELYEEVGDVYNEGKKDEAYLKFTKGAEELRDFSMNKALHDKIYRDFDTRFLERLFKQQTSSLDKYIPTGIDLLDVIMDGGTQLGETTLFLGDSGVGKSQLLIHLGIAASRRGHRVAHFQAEGTRQQALDRYDAAWTGTLYRDMKISNVDEERYKKLQKIVKRIGGEIYIEAREKFGNWSMVDIRNSLIEMIKSYGDISLLLIDYLDLVDPGDGKYYSPSEERFRQQNVAKLMKNIAVEFNLSLISVTQASAVPPESREDPDYLMTRWNLSEDKGKLRPFDNFFTLNQTRDEKRDRVMRIFPDKLREHDGGVDPILIGQNLARARFYDRKHTLNNIYSDVTLERIPWVE